MRWSGRLLLGAWLCALASCGGTPEAPGPDLLRAEAREPTLATRPPVVLDEPASSVEVGPDIGWEPAPPSPPRAAPAARRKYEDAHDDRVHYLAAQQREDGGWDASAPDATKRSDDPELTAVALQAYLRAGYTNRGRHPYARVVSRAARYLKQLQREDGRFVPPGGVGSERIHAACTTALLDLYGMTGSPIWKGAAIRGLEHLQARLLAGAVDTPEAEAWALCALLSTRAVNHDTVQGGRTPVLPLDEDAFRPLAAWATAARNGTDLEHALVGLALLLWPPEGDDSGAALEAWQREVRPFAWDAADGNADAFAALVGSLAQAYARPSVHLRWSRALAETLDAARVPWRDDDPASGALDPRRAGAAETPEPLRLTALLAAVALPPCYPRSRDDVRAE